jgi:Dolichyl-phosphate-mannose-protein mannosyltransferase
MKDDSARTKFSLSAHPAIVPLAAVFFSILLGFAEFHAPISGDTSIYAYYGRQIAHGQILYRDLWDFKSPGIYYLFALLFRIFPDSLTTLRVFAVAINIFSSWIFYKIGQTYFRSGSALAGSAILLTVTNLGGFLNQDGPFPETFIPQLGLLGFYFFLRSMEDGAGRAPLIYSGIFAGLLIALKQSSLSFAGGVLLFLSVEIYRFGWGKAGRLLTFLSGLAVAIIPWLLYFKLENAWDDFLNAVIFYPFSYAASTPLRSALQNFIALGSSSLAPLGIVFLLAGTGVLLVLRNQNQTQPQPGMLLTFYWLVAGILLICLPGRFYPRYLMEILAPVLILAALGINELFDPSEPGTNQIALRLLGFSLGGIFIFGTVLQQAPRALHIIEDRILNDVPTRSETLAGYAWFSARDVRVFAWGDPRIPYVAGVESGIKWLNTDPFFNATYLTPAIVDEVVRELTSDPPQYFVETPARPRLSESSLSGTRVDEYIHENYEFLIQVGDASVYEYKAAH